MKIIKPSTKMNSDPYENSSLETECLFGESVEIIDQHSGWYYCKALIDNYYGWIKKNSLGYLEEATHRIILNRSFVFENRDPKSFCINYLPIGSKLTVRDMDNDWATIELPSIYKTSLGYVPSKHIVTLKSRVKDWVKVAEQFLGIPYRWGGRDSLGIDCSALVQLSYEAYGYNIPRNTTDQIKLNKKLIRNLISLDRGCVVYWKGHVAVMIDKFNCIHANAYHMKTIIEPLEDIIKRFDGKYQLIKLMNFN